MRHPTLAARNRIFCALCSFEEVKKNEINQHFKTFLRIRKYLLLYLGMSDDFLKTQVAKNGFIETQDDGKIIDWIIHKPIEAIQEWKSWIDAGWTRGTKATANSVVVKVTFPNLLGISLLFFELLTWEIN